LFEGGEGMNGILCFGDSITFGVGEIPKEGWTGRLKRYHEPKGGHHAVFNLGIPGDTSSDLLKRFDIECKARVKFRRSSDRFAIIIAIGTNDCKWEGLPENNRPRTKEKVFEKNITKLIKKAKKYKTPLNFMGLPPVDETYTLPFENTSFTNERVKLFDSIIKKVCKKHNVKFLDVYGKMIKRKYQKLLEDGLHPNSKGYDLMFKIIKNKK
tara:strand:+ start:846 stop:1478 length:633 start_codon:yes stop_codon:yes gene_type:complete